MVLLGWPPAPELLYEVADPIHPKLLCRITGTFAHIFTSDTITYLRPGSATGTEVILRSLGSGNESIVAGIPLAGLEAPTWSGPTAWLPDGSLVAGTIQPPQQNAADQVRVWLYSQRNAGVVGSYPLPLIPDCHCRFRFPPPTLAFSADGQYLVAGWPIGKGASPLAVYRVSDRTQVTGFDAYPAVAMWDRAGHRLLLSGNSGTQAWTPESGFSNLAGAKQWSYLAGLSPDGSQVAYTAYADPLHQQQARVYLYDVKTDKTRLLVDQSRSQVVFIKSGWVWYLDESVCDPTKAGCGPWGTAPTGKVFAMDLSKGVESGVIFAAGEEPIPANDAYDPNLFTFAPGEFWPAG